MNTSDTERGPGMDWQLQDAKSRFSEMVRRTLEEGPQKITRHGEEVVVVIAADEFYRLAGGKPDFKKFLMGAPDFGELDIRRDRSLPREVDLDAS